MLSCLLKMCLKLQTILNPIFNEATQSSPASILLKQFATNYTAHLAYLCLILQTSQHSTMKIINDSIEQYIMSFVKLNHHLLITQKITS